MVLLTDPALQAIYRVCSQSFSPPVFVLISYTPNLLIIFNF